MRLLGLVASASLLVTLPACGSDSSPGPATSPPSILTGVIVAIDSESLGEPTSFTLRSEGTDYEIFIDPGRVYDFPLAHLNEHFQLSLPVRCDLEDRDGKLYAVTIEDA